MEKKECKSVLQKENKEVDEREFYLIFTVLELMLRKMSDLGNM